MKLIKIAIMGLVTLSLFALVMSTLYLKDQLREKTNSLLKLELSNGGEQKERENTEAMVASIFDAFATRAQPGTRNILIKGISSAVISQLPTKAMRESYVLVLGIESRFGTIGTTEKGKIRSSAGAVGMAQIMPQYGQELAIRCGLGKLDKEDLDRDIISLYLGACHFRTLVDSYGGNTALAMAAYNAGQGRIKGIHSSLPEETARYIARASIVLNSRIAKVEASNGD